MMPRKLLDSFPSLKRLLRRIRDRFFPSSSVSSSYVPIESGHIDSEAYRLKDSWQSTGMPVRQRELVNRQLENYQQGKAVDVFDVIVAALQNLKGKDGGKSLLEVGCSSGYYSEVLKIRNLPFSYTGCDYSEAFIALGRQYYPDVPFFVQDATALDFAESAFDVVVSGCCLLHIPDFEKAIAETARVARQYAIFHRTPVVTGVPHQYYRKQAYGIETVEIHFNEDELVNLFSRYGLKLIDTLTLSEEPFASDSDAMRYDRTYICKK